MSIKRKSRGRHHLFSCFIHKVPTFIAIHIYRDNYIYMYVEILEDVCTHAQRSSAYPQGLDLSFQVLKPLPLHVCPKERTQRSIVCRVSDWWLDDVCRAGCESCVGGAEVGRLWTGVAAGKCGGREGWRRPSEAGRRWLAATLPRGKVPYTAA